MSGSLGVSGRDNNPAAKGRDGFVTRTTIEFTLTEEQVDDGVLAKIRSFARKLGVVHHAEDSFEFDPDDPTTEYRHGC